MLLIRTQLANEFIESAGREGIDYLALTPSGQHALAVVYDHAGHEARDLMRQIHEEQGNTAVDYTLRYPCTGESGAMMRSGTVGVNSRIHQLGTTRESLPISENAWNDKLGGVMLYDVVAPDLLEAGARPYPNGIIDGESYQYVPYVYDAENDPSLAYYLAYNSDTKAIDWVVTPSQLNYFQENEGYARNYAAGFNPNEYELASARVGYYVAQGHWDSAADSLADSWSAALQDRGWWLNTALSVSGGLMARGAGPLKNSAATPAHNAANFAKQNELLSTIESANPLVESLRSSGQLPSNYVTKAQAVQRGWKPGKALGNSVPGGQLGGDVFQNTTNVLPSAQGRVWYEADVGLDGTISRVKQPGTRLLYSNDGLLYVTPDHYESTHLIGRWKD